MLLRSVVLAVAATIIPAATALGSSTQLSVMEDDVHLQADPAGTLEQMRALGADVVRVSMPWQLIAPNPNSKRAPRRFDASDPAAYPEAKWKVWDAIVTDAQRDGITVDLDVMGGAPRWALGPGPAGREHELKLGAVAGGVRAVRPGGRDAVQRRLRPRGAGARSRRPR